MKKEYINYCPVCGNTHIRKHTKKKKILYRCAECQHELTIEFPKIEEDKYDNIRHHFSKKRLNLQKILKERKLEKIKRTLGIISVIIVITIIFIIAMKIITEYVVL
jgi:DNA-directed RNA polymerase subunit M/transcription elongation factor TFIIS